MSYKPREHPQKLFWLAPGLGVDGNEDDIRKYGMPPPNYIAERFITHVRGDRVVIMRYTETSTHGNPSKTHPLDPGARDALILDEPTIARDGVRGLFHVPIKYKAGEMLWRHATDWQSAVAEGLNNLGIRNSGTREPITATDVQAKYDSIPPAAITARQNHVLYHPADRKSMVFPDEPGAAMAARMFGAHTILFCPWVDDEGKQYKYVYNTENRPPVYARWSTGQQGLFPPILLGCIPKQQTRDNKSFRAMWFSLKPKEGKTVTWHREMYTKPPITTLAENYGFPASLGQNAFLYAIVSLQRKIVVGYRIEAEHMACWIWQFGQHLETRKNSNTPTSALFAYDPSKLQQSKSLHPNSVLTFDTLSRLVLNRYMRSDNTHVYRYAELWDKFIDAQIQYQLKETDGNWDNFGSELTNLQRLPF